MLDRNCRRAAVPAVGRLRCARACSCAAALAVALLAACAPARAEWLYDLRVGASFDDNLSRAQRASDVRSDAAATAAASAGWFQALSGADGVTLSLEAAAESYARFHALNLVSLGGRADYRHKFGLGYAAPWIAIAVGAAHDDFRARIRDSDRLDASVEFGRRFTETFDASLGTALDRRIARNDHPVVPGVSGKPFDLRGQSAFARAAFDVDERLEIGARLALRRGDVESTTRRNLEIFEASDAIAADPAFGPDFYAYRLRGTTMSGAASLSWALSDHKSLNFGYAVARTRSYDGLAYTNRIGTIVLVFAY